MTDSRSGFGDPAHAAQPWRGERIAPTHLGCMGRAGPLHRARTSIFAYTPGQAWVWSTARAWLEVFPGVTAALGGFLLLISGNRATAMFGGWLAVIAGAWFVVGRSLASTLRLGDVGQPIAATDAKRAVIEIAYFSGLGHVDRLRRRGGPGASDDPDGAGRGIGPHQAELRAIDGCLRRLRQHPTRKPRC